MTNRKSLSHRLLGASMTLLLLTGCSLNRLAVNFLGDAFATGGSVYASDDDPELIREALPFGLKTFESLLELAPNHGGLLLAAARGFTVYAYLVQNQAERLDAIDFVAGQRMRLRVRQLYLRGRDYALRALANRHPGFIDRLGDNRDDALRQTRLQDAASLYWAGVAWAGAAGAAKNDPDLLISLPTAGDLVRRTLELVESFDLGAAQEFLISFEAARPGGSLEIARSHYQRALELSRGERASVYLALAESVSLRQQNLAEFQKLLQFALEVDVEKHPHNRLANRLAQERARWLQSRTHELFLEAETQEEQNR